jgi:hypothetical protein
LLGVQFIPPKSAGREWQSGRAVTAEGFETGNLKLETDFQPDADQMRRLIG